MSVHSSMAARVLATPPRITSSAHSFLHRLCSSSMARNRLWYDVSEVVGRGPRGAGEERAEGVRRGGVEVVGEGDAGGLGRFKSSVPRREGVPLDLTMFGRGRW